MCTVCGPGLTLGEVYKELVAEWFGNKDVFGPLASAPNLVLGVVTGAGALIIPRPWIATEIMAFYRAHFVNEYVVGLQVGPARSLRPADAAGANRNDDGI